MWRLPSGGARVKEEYDDAWSGVGYQPSPSSGSSRVKDEFVVVALSRLWMHVQLASQGAPTSRTPSECLGSHTRQLLACYWHTLDYHRLSMNALFMRTARPML
ncbi:hypothetical protein VPH35_129247 [Triticum aestivum]